MPVFPEGTFAEFAFLSSIKCGEDAAVHILYDKICRRKILLKSGHRSVIENEAYMLERFAGEGVPEVYGCFESDGRTYLLRRYIDGTSLRDLMESNGPFSAQKAVDICVSVCRILSRLHSSDPPVIHRDVKSDNIVISVSGEIFLVDFGTCREYDTNVNRDTHVLGTPIIAPPEQFGYAQTDERSDVYAVGVLLQELLTGSVKIDTSGLPRRLASIIKRCTEFSPDDRYENAMELERVLMRACDSKRFKVPLITAAACIAIAATMVLLPMLPSSVLRIGEKSAANSSFDSNGYYRFADSAIEAEVLRILDKEGGTVTKDDLELITDIMLVGKTPVNNWDELIIHGHEITVNDVPINTFGNVSSLEDLANMPNLSTVILCNQHIKDISPLASLSIRNLALHGNNITDISPLTTCSALERLYISSNPIEDLSPLTELYRLTDLNVGATQIESLDDIAEMRWLKRFEIHDCPNLSDVSALEDMNQLTFLSIRPCTEEALEMIKDMTSLVVLYIWQATELKELNQLSTLENVAYLVVDGCGLESLEGIEKLPLLTYLTIRYDYVSDLTPLIQAKNLSNITISGIPAKDYSALSQMNSLVKVSCSESQYEAVMAALENSEGISIHIE